MASPARQPLPEPAPAETARAQPCPAELQPGPDLPAAGSLDGPTAPDGLAVPDAAAFRRVVGRFATGVTVLTTVVDGHQLAMTANSFVSVSLDPLLVLVSVRQDARFHAPLLDAGVWGVSILAADMDQASRDFARRGADRPTDDGYGGDGRSGGGGGQLLGWRYSLGARTGVALLEGALAVLECRTVATHPGGDHTLVIGEVVALAAQRPDAAPLIFYEGSYLSADQPARSRRAGSSA
ncbi:flavin reductase [Parafrankia sp. FMc6]|uniref:flavin reductase family protein n=1 Tax=Parafrankia soli TaxID=2599596 RepID=UPI0034D4274A